MKLRSITKWLLLVLSVFVLFQILFPPSGLQPDNPPPIVSVLDREAPRPSKVFEVISVDPKFSYIENKLIEEAADNWEFYTDGLAKFKFVKGDPSDHPIETEPGQLGQAVIIRLVNSYEPKAILFDVLTGGNTLGFYEKGLLISTIWIIMNRVQDEDEFLAVVMHELGHSMGLSHTTHENTLMYPYVSTECVTQYDLKKFCHIYGCNPEDMNFCYSASDGLACLEDEEFNLKE